MKKKNAISLDNKYICSKCNKKTYELYLNKKLNIFEVCEKCFKEILKENQVEKMSKN